MLPSAFTQDSKTLMLVDGHALIYRAFYAFPNLTSPTGELVNAVYGFSRILLAAIRDLEPDYIAVVFDHPKPTFRHQEFADYKAHRPEMPVDLRPQIERVKEVVRALNIPQFEEEGYEADDLIGTLTQQVAQADLQDKLPEPVRSVVVTGDKDLFQLIDDFTHIWLPGRGKRHDEEYDREKVYAKMGIYPEQVVDLKALMGDASDNIPGVKGVGQKTAAKLIQEFGSLESVYQAVEEVQQSGEETAILKGALLKKLIKDKDNAFLSQKLAAIERQAPIKLDLESCQVTSYDKEAVVELFKEFEFRSLISMLPDDEFESGVQDALF